MIVVSVVVAVVEENVEVEVVLNVVLCSVVDCVGSEVVEAASVVVDGFAT